LYDKYVVFGTSGSLQQCNNVINYQMIDFCIEEDKNMKKYALFFIMVLLVTSCTNPTIETDVASANETIDILNNKVNDLTKDVEDVTKINLLLEAEVLSVTEAKDALAEEMAELEADKQLIAESNSPESALTGPYSGQLLMEAALDVLDAINHNDLIVLASYVDPTEGLRLHPNQYINTSTAVALSPTDIIDMSTIPTTYTWGTHPGSGDPLDFIITDYFAEYVADEDYLAAPIIGQNTVVSSGNMINNISTQYPTESFVEFHFPQFDPQYTGLDWKSLTLVFDVTTSIPVLVGVVHGTWTP